MRLREQLIELGRLYGEHKGLAPSTVGTYLFREGNLFPRLQAGSDIGTARFEQFMAIFDEKWPADLAWPADIPRPSKGKCAA